MSAVIPEYEYQFEIETILHQFLAIVDNALVRRYDKDHQTGQRTLVNTIKPHYVFGLKSRIEYSLVNKANNYTLPLIGINLKSIKADRERLQDKTGIMSRFYNGTLEGVRRPTPITIGVTLTIVTKFMTDMYQIAGKFFTLFQPYCVYSWAVPSDDRFSYEELRNKIEWDMNLQLETHEKLTQEDEERYTATMNFSVQGWLFTNQKSCVEGIILDIGTSVIAENDLEARIIVPDGEPASMSPFAPLADQYIAEYNRPYHNPREFANAHPRITHCFIQRTQGGKAFNFPISVVSGNLNGVSSLLFKGYNLKEANALLIPPEGETLPGEPVRLDYCQSELFKVPGTTESKSAKVLGWPLKVLSRGMNTMTVDLSSVEWKAGSDIVIYDNVDYDRLSFYFKGGERLNSTTVQN